MSLIREQQKIYVKFQKSFHQNFSEEKKMFHRKFLIFHRYFFSLLETILIFFLTLCFQLLLFYFLGFQYSYSYGFIFTGSTSSIKVLQINVYTRWELKIYCIFYRFIITGLWSLVTK